MNLKQKSLFAVLPDKLESILREGNPWWRGESIFQLPKMRRWAFTPVLQGLQDGLTPAVVLRGPRQIGKTTLLEQIIGHLLDNNVSPRQIFRVQFDDLPELGKVRDVSVILELCRWFLENILHKSLNQAAIDGEQSFIFLDEVQNLPDWAPQLKHLVDMHPVSLLPAARRCGLRRDATALPDVLPR